MAYFSHAFQKMLWGGNAGDNGFVTSGNYTDFVPGGTSGVGSFAFVDHTITNAANPWPVQAAAPTGGEPLTLVSTSILQNDKIGPFHGGYQEASKSKIINPKYVNKFYKVQAALPQTNVIGVGSTPNLDLTTGACCPTFWCNENYYLRVDLKGSPVLRMLNHNAYEVAAAYTGCCDGPTPEQVDPADVMMAWANYIDSDPILSGNDYGPVFSGLIDQRLVNVGVTVTCDNGATWDLYLPANKVAGQPGLYFEADGTTLTAAATAFVASLEGSVTGTVVLLNAGSLVPGTGYTTATAVPVTGGTGTGLTVDITAVAGNVTVVTINTPGTGYTNGDTVTIAQVGSGLDATIDIDGAAGVANLSFATVTPITSYTSAFTPATPNCCAGLVMEAAFVETTFANCTFQPTDHYELEPLLLQASMLDETGDPCVFEQLCISDGTTPSGAGSTTVYPAMQNGTQAMGTGETILRELILSEGYNQNSLATDLRIREITQGNDIVDEVNRGSLYTCYYILHSVPRFNNATGVFDNDQYLLKIPVEDPTATGTGIAGFETFVNTWLSSAGNPVQLEVY